MAEVPEPVAQNAQAIVEAVRRLPEQHPIVLIDGPSGAGKSTTADAVVAAWPGSPPTLVRMDDVYPGWSGLDAAGEHVARHLLDPLSRTETGWWQRWDWFANQHAEWHNVAPETSLVIEGCGVLTRHNAHLSHLRVWIDGNPSARKRRALERDRGGFDAHWDDWTAQMSTFIERERPRSSADLVLWADD